MEGRGEVLILSSNNYLGLCDEPAVIEAGIDGLQKFGAGTASVRFICGTFTIHRELEDALARVRRHARRRCRSCRRGTRTKAFTATIVAGGRLRRLRRAQPRVDHRLDAARARRSRKCTTGVYKHADMDDLRAKLAEAKGAKRRIIWTDGVFSMEGAIAKLPDILQIARDTTRSSSMDDSHATGVLGKTGRGTAEHFGVLGEVDIITSTLGKALGGAAGGFVAGSAALRDYLTQRSRPQLFSNALPPTVAASALAAVRFVEQHPERVEKLRENTKYFREQITEAGFKPLARRDADRSDHRRRDGGGDSDERHAARRRRVRDGLRISGRAAGPGARSLPDLGGALARRSRRSDSRVQEGRREARHRTVMIVAYSSRRRRRRRCATTAPQRPPSDHPWHEPRVDVG